jgi:hypothetical protein
MTAFIAADFVKFIKSHLKGKASPGVVNVPPVTQDQIDELIKSRHPVVTKDYVVGFIEELCIITSSIVPVFRQHLRCCFCFFKGVH